MNKLRAMQSAIVFAQFLAAERAAVRSRSYRNFAGHYRSEGRTRTHTKDDEAAFDKRIAKRRAKKGYR